MAKKSTDLIVEKAVHAIIHGGSNSSFLNQLANMQEHIEKQNYTSLEERENAFPLFKDYTVSELKQIKTRIYVKLKEVFSDKELSYLQVFRMIVAVDVLYPNRRLTGNPKAEFARFYWELCCSCCFPMDECMKKLKKVK